MSRTPLISQPFCIKVNNKLNMLCGKTVDELIFTGQPTNIDRIISGFNKKCSLGTIVHGSGHLRLLGLELYQKYDYSTYIDADDKIKFSRTRSDYANPPPENLLETE